MKLTILHYLVAKNKFDRNNTLMFTLQYKLTVIKGCRHD